MINWIKKQIKINTLENKLETLEKENIELLRKITFKDDEIQLLKEQIKKLKENKKKNIETIEKLNNIINSIKPYIDIISYENFDEECEYMKKLLDEVK